MVTIRTFKMEELDEIIKIYIENFKDKTDNIEYTTNKFKKDVKRFTKLNIPGDILVAIEKDEIVGFASFILKGHWYFGPIAVNEKWRNRKIGEKLMEESLNYIKKAGGGLIRLTVQKRNETAIKLYEKFRFKISSYIMELEI
ncbi:MAG: GNAT family N-acetyltransferase [Candidatus Helarchaeota archaeon]|nr:GNAT family N-acetyltransferase [Candidatus Helarchaeota archaeon]